MRACIGHLPPDAHGRGAGWTGGALHALRPLLVPGHAGLAALASAVFLEVQNSGPLVGAYRDRLGLARGERVAAPEPEDEDDRAHEVGDGVSTEVLGERFMAFPFAGCQESGDEPGPRTPCSPKSGLLLVDAELERVEPRWSTVEASMSAAGGVGFVVAGLACRAQRRGCSLPMSLGCRKRRPRTDGS